MKKLRKFTITKIEEMVGGPSPNRLYRVYYRAIIDKIWIDNYLNIIARNEKEARSLAEADYGGYN